ncbi:hypothetical protein [Streptomyces sp. NBC_00878]|uniref:SCO2400 family protein n=1 Tax=Streptomyces sp. NBC_00878 TaxID=2975854 RepID=UPI0022520229|nr:hypothetical protein [Streptomyces sp. NBC_00878]MCX4907375.1 hypothetical protein [Streptomyces sp. NBC_00878]
MNETAVGADLNEAPRTSPSGDIEGVTPAPQGRAARRRQLARWKKNKRRAVVATAVAIVGGGLTVTSMDRNANDRAQASTAPADPGSEDQAAERPQLAPRPDTPGAPHIPGAPGTPESPTTPRTQQTRTAQSPETTPQRRQSFASPPRTGRAGSRPDGAVSLSPTGTTAPPSGNTSPSSDEAAPGGTDTATTQPSDPADAAGGTQPGTTPPENPANPSPAATSPSQICVLVLCLG